MIREWQAVVLVMVGLALAGMVALWLMFPPDPPGAP